MCGLFGFVATDASYGPEMALLKEIAINTETRGDHSFGFAWLDDQNRLRSYKQVGAISDNLPRLRMVRGASMIIGHCRWASRGAINYRNAHPFPCDGGWVMHNGTIGHSDTLNRRYKLSPQTECDSETIAMLMEHFRGTLVERVTSTIDQCATSSFAMLGLWKSPGRLVIGRAGNPLHIAKTDAGYYFASLPDALPRGATSIKNHSVMLFSRQGGMTRVRSVNLARSESLFS